MAVLLLSHPAGLGHDTGPGHPERIDRLPADLETIKAYVRDFAGV